jgi:hypothetical protein
MNHGCAKWAYSADREKREPCHEDAQLARLQSAPDTRMEFRWRLQTIAPRLRIAVEFKADVGVDFWPSALLTTEKLKP